MFVHGLVSAMPIHTNCATILTPFQCYLGLRRLQRAISLYRTTYPDGQQDEFRITHVPYILDTSAPYPSIPIEERMGRRMGDERAAKTRQFLTRLGQADGIAFKFGGKVGRTRDAHRLVQLATAKDGRSARGYQPPLEEKVVEELYRAFFEEEKDIAEWDVLVEIGLRADLGDEGELRDWLKSDGGGTIVDRQVQQFKKDGVRGVPRFEIQGAHRVEGAEDPGAFFEIFVKIKEENM